MVLWYSQEPTPRHVMLTVVSMSPLVTSQISAEAGSSFSDVGPGQMPTPGITHALPSCVTSLQSYCSEDVYRLGEVYRVHPGEHCIIAHPALGLTNTANITTPTYALTDII